MSGGRFVFDAPCSTGPVSVYSNDELPGRIVVVSDDAIVNSVNGDSMPSDDSAPVTIATLEGVHRGRCIGLAYLIELDP